MSDKLSSAISEHLSQNKSISELDVAIMTKAMKLMLNSPRLLLGMLESGKFLSTHHYIHSFVHPNGEHACSDCYSGDTEFNLTQGAMEPELYEMCEPQEKDNDQVSQSIERFINDKVDDYSVNLSTSNDLEDKTWANVSFKSPWRHDDEHKDTICITPAPPGKTVTLLCNEKIYDTFGPGSVICLTASSSCLCRNCQNNIIEKNAMIVIESSELFPNFKALFREKGVKAIVPHAETEAEALEYIYCQYGNQGTKVALINLHVKSIGDVEYSTDIAPTRKFHYVNGLQREYSEKKCVTRVEFSIDRYNKLFQTIEFKDLVSERKAVEVVENYFFCGGEYREDAEKNMKIKEGVLFIEQITIDKDGNMKISCVS